MPPETVAAPAPEVEAPVVPETKEAPKSAEKMYQVKVNGKVEEWPESKVIERAQKSEGAEQAMKKAAEYEKAFGNFVAQSQNPAQLIALLESPALKYDDAKQEALVTAMLDSKKPHLIEAVKKWIYKNEIEPTTLSDGEKLKRLEASITAERKAQTDEQEKTKADADAQAAWNKMRLDIGAQIKAAQLPEKPGVVKRMIAYGQLYVKQGQYPNFADCAKRVKLDLINEMKEIYSGLTEDDILNLMDEETPQKINKALLKKLNAGAKGTNGTEQRKPDGKKPTREETKKLFRDLRRKIGSE